MVKEQQQLIEIVNICINNHKGDLIRAKAVFKHIEDKNTLYGESGLTVNEILKEYNDAVEDTEKLITWIKAQ